MLGAVAWGQDGFNILRPDPPRIDWLVMPDNPHRPKIGECYQVVSDHKGGSDLELIECPKETWVNIQGGDGSAWTDTWKTSSTSPLQFHVEPDPNEHKICTAWVHADSIMFGGDLSNKPVTFPGPSDVPAIRKRRPACHVKTVTP